MIKPLHAILVYSALLFPLAAQHHITVHVACGPQHMVDHEWTLDMDVEYPDGNGGTAKAHVHVNISKSDNANSIVDALIHKLHKKTKLDFSSAETSHPKSGEKEGQDLVMPETVVITRVETRKKLAKWTSKDDHLKVWDGDTQLNVADGKEYDERSK